MNTPTEEFDPSGEPDHWIIETEINTRGHSIQAAVVAEKLDADRLWLWPIAFYERSVDRDRARQAASAIKIANPVTGKDGACRALTDWAKRVSNSMKLS